MIQRDDYIMAEATYGSERLWDEEYRIFFEYFPNVGDGRVYVESERETFWYKSNCIGEVREEHIRKHVIYNKRELKAV